MANKKPSKKRKDIFKYIEKKSKSEFTPSKKNSKKIKSKKSPIKKVKRPIKDSKEKLKILKTSLKEIMPLKKEPSSKKNHKIKSPSKYLSKPSIKKPRKLIFRSILKNKKIVLKSLILGLIFASVGSIITFIITFNVINTLIIFGGIFFLLQIYVSIRFFLKRTMEIKKMEEVFPDFIELMSSNLRAGMTVDKALLMSSRKEFHPLDLEILNLGKDIVTGGEITSALVKMGKRINSEKINKTISVINSGMKSGGNLAILLEQTAQNMRERSFVEKRAASNVLMYIIFIFFAVSIGAPLLFALSSILVETLNKILGNMPSLDKTVTQNLSTPFILTSINISTKFINIFATIFLIIIDLLASLLIGLVRKGEEKEGLKYFVPLTIISLLVFFVMKLLMIKYISQSI